MKRAELRAGDAVVAGIDVGGPAKGFHAVALRGGAWLDQFTSTDPAQILAWCRRVGARAVGMDAPCGWSSDGRARPAERQLMAAGISCFASPTRERALAHPSDYYGWMLAGERLFALLRRCYRLIGDPPAIAHSGDAPLMFETFPQAITVAMSQRAAASSPSASATSIERSAASLANSASVPRPSGRGAGDVSAKNKRSARRAVLHAHGIDIATLTNIDWVDAALCALSAKQFLAGRVRFYGERRSGCIVVPLAPSVVSAALVVAYRTTRYEVMDGRHRFALNVDRCSAPLLAAYARHGVTRAAYLTACNPRSRRHSAAENRRRMAALETALRRLGRAALAGRGEDPTGAWSGEPSVLALGASEAEARALGHRFGQNAVLHAGSDGVPRLLLLR